MTDPTGGATPEKPNEPSGLALTLKLDGATWGDLRYYVRTLDDIPDDVPLGLDIYDSPYEDSSEIVGLCERINRART